MELKKLYEIENYKTRKDIFCSLNEINYFYEDVWCTLYSLDRPIDAHIFISHYFDEPVWYTKELEYEKWKPTLENKSYQVDSYGDIIESEYNTKYNKYFILCYRQRIGNCFKTQEEAKKYKKDLEWFAIHRELKDIADFLNGDWKPNCLNSLKYFIRHYRNTISIDVAYSKFENQIFFKTKELAQKAIEIIGQEKLKRYSEGI